MDQSNFAAINQGESQLAQPGREISKQADSKLNNEAFDALKIRSGQEIALSRINDNLHVPIDTAIYPLDWTKPLISKPELTDEEKKEKQASINDQLDKSISGLASDSDRAALQKLDKAIVTGDQQTISSVVASTDPQKLEAYAHDLQRNLKAAGCDLQVKAMDGELYMYEEGKDHALEFSPGSAAHVRKFDASEQGTLAVSPDPVLDPTVDELMKQTSQDVCSPPQKASIGIPSIWDMIHRSESAPAHEPRQDLYDFKS
jgi:hypothetical protein